ncbi:hypothetical protein [Nonomuraea rhizosphaerae]|uniref:hypothetical protein n=1 Tax=Nonomuraea rhizosphaerae TaxID=2665663 RepID=UPI001C5FEA3E|nr:hypothetical protein [Nonomuraea rhizosphaerae]
MTASGLLLWAGPAAADDHYGYDRPTSEISTHKAKQASDFFVADWNGIRTGSMDAGRAGASGRRYGHQQPWYSSHGWGGWGGSNGWPSQGWMSYGGEPTGR